MVQQSGEHAITPHPARSALRNLLPRPSTTAGKLQIGALVLLALILLYGGWRSSAKVTIPIGLVVPDKASSEGITMINSAKLALQQLNRQAHNRPIRFVLKILEDHHTLQQAQHAAGKLASSRAPIVVGHADNAINSKVAVDYRRLEIPIINPSATNTDFLHYNDWVFSTMASAALQGNFLLHFLNSTTKRSAIYLFETDDDASRDLAESVVQTAKALGIPILKRWRVVAAEPVSEQQLDAILDTLRNDPEQQQHALLIAGKVQQGVQLITSMKRIGHRLMVLAPHNFADHRFLAALNQYPQARAQPGYYSDGLFVVTPFLSQAGLTNRTALEFQNRFQETYHHAPDWLAAAWYDAVFTAGQAIARLSDQTLRSADTRQLRVKVRDQLRRAYTYERGTDGVNGRIYFNPEGEAFRSLAVGFYSRQRLIPADYQFQPLIYPDREQHVLENVLQGKIFIGIDGQLFRKTRVVYTGIDFNRIDNLDLLNSSFDADFYLWFRYRGKFDDREIDFLNATDPITLGKPIMTDSSNGMTTHAYRVRGTFRSPFDFHDYPFDHQQLKVEFKHQQAQKKDLLYVTDIQGLRQGIGDHGRTSLHLGGWSVQPTEFFQEIASTSSTLGVARFMARGNLIEYSQFTASITLIRDAFNFVIKHLMTLVILLIVTYIIYYLPPNQMELSGGITMTSLLTAAVMHQEMNASLPEVGYTVAIDYVFFISYIMMASSALYPLIQYNRARARRSLETVHLVGRIGYPLGVLSIIVTMYYLLNKS